MPDGLVRPLEMHSIASSSNPFAVTPEHPDVVILDGGLATTLEARGYDLRDPLWSARLLIEAPDAIRQVHYDFLLAGADCITTASYQASLEGFAARGIGASEGAALLQRSVSLALEARDAFWAAPGNRRGRRRPLVAASIGPYGAYLANGAEYTGRYDANDAILEAFHRSRWAILAQTDADLLAIETIPSAREARLLLRLLKETPQRQAWLSLCCGDEDHLWDGTRVSDVARWANEVDNLIAIGVNCVAPQLILPLVQALRAATTKPVIAYPNAGEDYDITTRAWVKGSGSTAMEDCAPTWVAHGLRAAGGCCRTDPGQIRRLRERLSDSSTGGGLR